MSQMDGFSSGFKVAIVSLKGACIRLQHSAACATGEEMGDETSYILMLDRAALQPRAVI